MREKLSARAISPLCEVDISSKRIFIRKQKSKIEEENLFDVLNLQRDDFQC